MNIIRLDDACEKRDIKKWDRIEKILDKYNVKAIVGIIPNCKDPDMDKYLIDDDFWKLVKKWQDKGWIIALHGYEHVFCTQECGINPVNNYSEFAGVSLEEQKQKISKGVGKLKEHGIEAQIFFAPAHTFDENTVTAVKECSDIRIISDTIAYDKYLGEDGMTYIPQQSGRVRKLLFKTVTFCYHPNLMDEDAFNELENFLEENRSSFSEINLAQSERKLNLLDKLLSAIYFKRRRKK